MNRSIGVLASVALLALGLCTTSAHAVASTTVTNTADTGAGSLRDAITNANGNPGLDVIDFNIAAAGVQTITPATGLPSFTDPVIVDGYTQPGTSKNSQAVGTNAVLKIEISGSSLTNSNILSFGSGSAGSTVRGLVLNNLAGGGQAVRFFAGTDAGFKVAGCFIGTNAAGTAPAPNPGGIASSSGSAILVGGTNPGDRNLISGNTGDGINFGGSLANGNTIRNNLIGVDKNGSPLPNGGSGVAIIGGAIGTRIVDNDIQSDNNSLGIDLDNDGVTANDKRDPDTGSNNLQNFPVLSFATANTDGSTTITGKLNSRPKKLFTIQFFANENGDEPDGEIPLGQLNIKTNRFGKATFTFITTETTSPGQTVTATATNVSTNETSEFSAPVPVAVG